MFVISIREQVYVRGGAMGSDTLDRLLDEVFGPSLTGAGFTRARPRRWERRSREPISEIFNIQAIGGAMRSARWVFSLDFVPNFQNRRFRWKRTFSDADIDICIDPINDTSRLHPWHSFTYVWGSEAYPSEVAAVASTSVRAAFLNFDRIRSVQDVVTLFERRAARDDYRRFSPDNYVQTDLAWGLALFATGRPEQGQQHLARFHERFATNPNDPLIVKSLTSAKQLAQASSA